MKWTSVLSEKTRLDEAIRQVGQGAIAALGSVPDLALVFPSHHYAPDFARIPELVGQQLQGGILIGCSAGAVIGGGHEIEERPAISLVAATLPDVTLHPFHLEQDDLPDEDASPRAWQEMVGIPPTEEPHFIILADPFSIQVGDLLLGLDYAFPQSKKIGGMASGADRPGANAVYMGHRVWGVGVVGVALSGNIDVTTVVAQGCRPVGSPLRVTACRQNILLGLDDKQPVEALRSVYETLSEEDQELARTSLHLGVLTDELRESFGRGDFLIRNILGIDPKSGVMAVGEHLRRGQTVQFHLRDSQTSADDLDHLLARYLRDNQARTEEGALLFSCLGRGTHLYGRPDHDSELFRKRLGSVPLGGFFCSGEIGPVGHSTFVHGFTSSFGIFKPRTA